MYLIAIAWVYVVLLMAASEASVIGGVMTFLWFGVAPLALLVWLLGTPQRRRNRLRQMAEKRSGQPDGADSKTDE